MIYPLDKLQWVDKRQLPNGFMVNAPISGNVRPLAHIDQPLINHGLLGEGVAIEVSGNKLTAPFDGCVIELPGSGHRIQLRASNGIKLLILFSQENDRLMGQGFNTQVREGATVSRDQPLASFNLQQWQSLNPHTPLYAAVFITNPELIGNIYCAADRVTAAEDRLLTITPKKKPKSP